MRQAPVSGKLNGRTSKMNTANPCIGLCRFGGDGACLGCHRSKAEVKGWKRLSDAAKAAINARIGARIGAGNGVSTRHDVETGSAEGKATRKRRRKLDRKIGKLEVKLALLRAERDRLVDSRVQTPESSR